MTRRRSSASETRRRERQLEGLRQLPYADLTNPYPPFEILAPEQIERIHLASLEVLERLGINFLLPEARELLKAAGAEVAEGSATVRFDRGLILERMATVPPRFTMHARNPARNRIIGDNHISFCLVASPPNVSDLERGRRTGNFADYCDLLKLGQSLNIIHCIAGYPVEPIDLPPPIRHLKAEQAMATLTDRCLYGYALGRRRIRDSIELARLARGISEEQLLAEPSTWTVVNANSPRQYDRPMLWGMIELARLNQPVIVTPFTLAGAMAPVTLAGALVQQNAEALAGMVFCQIVRPGAPVMYGGFTSNVDMRTGAPAFGTPEYAKAVLIGGQLARRYRVPYRSSNANASNAPDGQSVYESEMSIWSVLLAHCNLVKHAAGWIEGGLTASFEKVMLDAEMLQMAAEMLRPVAVDDASLALDAIAEVAPGGHYFGAAHTLERFKDAFYEPLLSDWRNFETWSEDGAKTATQRAHTLYKQVLAAYEPPPMDPAVREALDEFVARRIAEGGATADD
jgi:trimethylamine--corrinoid protein Co-methyltransferase